MGYRTDDYERSLARLDHVRFGLKPRHGVEDLREIQGDGVFWLLRTLFQTTPRS